MTEFEDKLNEIARAQGWTKAKQRKLALEFITACGTAPKFAPAEIVCTSFLRHLEDIQRQENDNVPAILAEAIAGIPSYVEVYYVQYDEELNTEQLQRIIDGEATDVSNDIEEYNADNVWETMNSIAKSALDDDEEKLDILRNSDEWSTFEEAVYDRDKSGGLMTKLLHNTGNTMFRYNLDVDVPDYTALEDAEQHAAIMDEIFAAFGPGVERNEANENEVKAMLVEASYGGVLSVIWYGDAEDVLTPLMNEEWGNVEVGAHTITFTNPHLVILNGWNGSGFDGEIQGTITKPYLRDNLRLDGKAKGRGYTWDDVAGIHYGAYRSDVTITAPEKE